jgi:hypothetical protein
MGVECDVFLIDDWPGFIRTLSETNDTFRTVDPLEPGPNAPTKILSAQVDFSESLAAMRRKWTGESADSCRHLFAHLFWIYRGDERYQIIDLAGMKRPFGLDVAWGPETMRKFGEVARRIDLDGCRSVFSTGKQYRFTTHEEFAEYGGFWLSTVRRAADTGRRLAVVVYG